MRGTLIAAALIAAGLYVSSRGGRHGFVYRSRHRAYRGMAKTGLSKSARAAIGNAGRTAAGRRRMARKAAATRKRRGR
jgi:hypothetical protein